MREFVVVSVSAIETPHTLTDNVTGKVFPMVSLEVDFIHSSGKPDQFLLHFAPQHLESMLPKLTEVIRLALLMSTAPGEVPEKPH